MVLLSTRDGSARVACLPAGSCMPYTQRQPQRRSARAAAPAALGGWPFTEPPWRQVAAWRQRGAQAAVVASRACGIVSPEALAASRLKAPTREVFPPVGHVAQRQAAGSGCLPASSTATDDPAAHVDGVRRHTCHRTLHQRSSSSIVSAYLRLSPGDAARRSPLPPAPRSALASAEQRLQPRSVRTTRLPRSATRR